MECVFDDFSQSKLLVHRDLRRQERRRLDLAIEQRLSRAPKPPVLTVLMFSSADIFPADKAR